MALRQPLPTQSVISKACKHFRLGSIEHELVLVIPTGRSDTELSDDTMRRLPEGAIVDLRRIPEETYAYHYGRGNEARYVCLMFDNPRRLTYAIRPVSWADTASQVLGPPHICDAEVPIPRTGHPDGESASTMVVLVKTSVIILPPSVLLRGA